MLSVNDSPNYSTWFYLWGTQGGTTQRGTPGYCVVHHLSLIIRMKQVCKLAMECTVWNSTFLNIQSEVGPDGHSQRWNSLELVKGSYGQLDLAKDIAEIKFDRPVQIKEGVKYAVRLRNHGNRTVNGDGGVTHMKCPDGVTFSFSLCRLSSNGTSQTRGQIPQLLYYK